MTPKGESGDRGKTGTDLPAPPTGKLAHGTDRQPYNPQTLKWYQSKDLFKLVIKIASDLS